MNKLNLIICSTLALCVSGCSMTTRHYTEQSGFLETTNNDSLVQPVIIEQPPAPLEMSIEKRAYLESQQTEFTKDLAKDNTGVIINKQGNDLLLYIPVSEAFHYNGFQLTPYGYNVLSKIALNMLDQEFSEFTVSIYDGMSGYKHPDYDIVEVRARVTTDFILSRRVNPDKIHYSPQAIPAPPLIDPLISYIEIRIKNDVNNFR
jgi:hypothetical protein